MKDIVVFDLDGTLANIDHRLPLIKREKPDWEEFFNRCVDDVPNEWALKLNEAMANNGLSIFIVSGRPERTWQKSARWLRDFGFRMDQLILVRPDGDYTPDHELKKKWLNESGLKDRILFVVDDRQRVVDMWREEGLVCLQCYAWPEWKKNYQGA